jgi:NAD(P)H-hydrate epimerase
MQKQYVISREDMYSLDKRTMNEFGLESQVLMEVAGLKSTQKILEIYNVKNYSFLLMCGQGNNGGDGFVIARWLINSSANVTILFVGNEDKMSPETLNNYRLCQTLGCTFLELNDFLATEINSHTIVIDALLGIGFQGELKETFARVIDKVNRGNTPRIAIDIPSGVNANTGEVNLAFNADYTFTMAAIKQGMLLNSAPAYCGKVEVIDISIPDQYYQELDFFANIHNNLTFPKRFNNSHKGDYGKILIVAASPSFSGAAILCSKACVKAGAGLVKLLHPQGMETIFESSLTEVMTKGISEDLQLSEYLDWSDVVLIGPGLGQSLEAEKLLTKILHEYHKKLVIDADGLNLLAKNKQLLLETKAQVLLTPHLGEFSRLIDKSLAELKLDTIKYAREFIQEYPVSLLLKSAKSIYLDQNRAMFNIRGNDGLSTGGSGDVLAGIITAFIGQKMEIADSAINAAYYLGYMVEKMSETQNSFSIIPTEIINNIGKI